MPDPAPSDPSPKHRRRPWLRRLVAYPLFTLLGLLTVRWTSLAESQVFYVPSREPFESLPGCEDVSFPTPDGLLLHGWFVHPRGSKAGPGPWPTILHCHGNAGNISSHIDFSEFLAEDGFAVLIFDYRGYGRSSPASGLTRDKLMVDSTAALDYLLTRRDVDHGRLGAYGVSIGGVFAARLAADRTDVKALCTVATFSSWRGIAADHLPVIGPLMLPGGLDPEDAVAALGGKPYLIVHGAKDEIANVRHAGILESAARSGGVPVTKLIVPGADHNGVMFTDQGEQKAVCEFFERALPSAGR